MTERPYRCKHCNGIALRDSDKAWVKSVCGTTGKNVHLMRLSDADLAELGFCPTCLESMPCTTCGAGL